MRRPAVLRHAAVACGAYILAHCCRHGICYIAGVTCISAEPVQVSQGEKPKLDPEAVTKKWGLEAGLFNIFTSKEEAGQDGQSKGQQVGLATCPTCRLTMRTASLVIRLAEKCLQQQLR
jgi:hypothetical protein